MYLNAAGNLPLLVELEKNTIPTGGLVAYYPFNGNANDESGNANNGIVYGATLSMDRLGNENNAYSFSGAGNNYIAFSNILNVNNEMTVSVWIKPNFNPSNISDYPQTWPGVRNVIRKSAPGYQETYWLVFVGNSLSLPYISYAVFYEGGGSKEIVFEVPGIIEMDNWYNIVITYKRNDKMKLFINGNEVASQNTLDKPLAQSLNKKMTISQTTDYLNQESYWSDEVWKGMIDDIRIYNCALNEQEIMALCN